VLVEGNAVEGGCRGKHNCRAVSFWLPVMSL
jgi:hypothetical protein